MQVVYQNVVADRGRKRSARTESLVKVKSIPVQACTGPEGSRWLRLPDIKKIGTWKWWCCQPYSLAAITPREYSCYSCVIKVGWTPGPLCGRKNYVN